MSSFARSPPDFAGVRTSTAHSCSSPLQTAHASIEADDRRDVIDLSFNPDVEIRTMRFGVGGFCCVVDDVLRFPEEWVRYAVARKAEFASAVPMSYPGTYLPLDQRAADAMREFFDVRVRRHFGARRTVHLISRYSMVTLAPSDLVPRQWICHQDPPAEDPRLSSQACVLYLFRDDTLGGTSFFEPTRSFAETSQLFADLKALSAAEFTDKYHIRPSYQLDSNAYFKRTATVPARWNRAIFYSGSQFHSGQILAPERLSADPATGRLTANFFFTCRRNLVTA